MNVCFQAAQICIPSSRDTPNQLLSIPVQFPFFFQLLDDCIPFFVQCCIIVDLTSKTRDLVIDRHQSNSMVIVECQHPLGNICPASFNSSSLITSPASFAHSFAVSTTLETTPSS